MKKTLTTLLALASIAISGSAADWKPAGDLIKTKWAEQIDPAAPLAEYPRPQMVRNNWMNLNGLWDYAITPESATDFTSEGSILVPFAVESSLSGVGRMVGKDQALWYQRSFDLPKGSKGEDHSSLRCC